MRHLLAGFLLLVASLTLVSVHPASSGTVFPAIGSSPNASIADEFTFFPVSVEVKDSNDSPIVGAQVLAFSDDWGIRIPGTLESSLFLTTDSSGHAILQVPIGAWTFFAFHGGFGKCFFLTASVQVQSSSTISLRPNSTFSVSLFSLSGNLVDIDELRIIDEPHAQIVPTAQCGNTSGGQISVAVNSQGPFRILAVRRPSASEGYYLLATNVSPSQNLEIRPSASSTSAITFRALGVDSSPTSGNVEVRLPDLDINNMVIAFSFTNQATIIFTPMPVVFNFRFMTNGWYLYFSSEAYQLSAGSSFEVRFGGPLTKQLQVIPHASTGQGGSPAFAPMTQIWLKIADQFGHILLLMSTPTGRPNFPFTVSQGGSQIFQGSIPQGDPFTIKTISEYSDSASPSYSVSGDLGPFGTFSINGNLISADTNYQLSTFNSAHFKMVVPSGLGEQTNRITSYMDQLYEKAQEMTGQPINGDIQYEVDLMGGGFSWENLPAPTKLLLIMYLGTDPLNPSTLFTTSHEFGHTRTLRDPTKIAFDFWGESYPSLIAIEGISRIIGPKMWLWLTGQHDFFFYHLQGRPESDRSQQIEASQFVLAYLEKKFGWDIHYRLFSQWSSGLSAKAQVLLNNGFQPSEDLATLYSYLANQNLAGIFDLAGLNVSQQRVQDGLNLIGANTTIPVTATSTTITTTTTESWTSWVTTPIVLTTWTTTTISQPPATLTQVQTSTWTSTYRSPTITTTSTVTPTMTMTTGPFTTGQIPTTFTYTMTTTSTTWFTNYVPFYTTTTATSSVFVIPPAQIVQETTTMSTTITTPTTTTTTVPEFPSGVVLLFFALLLPLAALRIAKLTSRRKTESRRNHR